MIDSTTGSKPSLRKPCGRPGGLRTISLGPSRMSTWSPS